MEDHKIVDLYWQRSENAIKETSTKYGRMLDGISYSLLSSREDAEECVNDTYLEAWNKMPDDRPAYLGAYLSRIVRCISIDRFRASHRQKRGEAVELTDELADCINAHIHCEDYDCPVYNYCKDTPFESGCRERIKNWLKQEAEK